MRCFIYGRALVETTSRLQAIYSGAVVTIASRNYSGESEVNSIMAKSREYSILLQAWSGWRNAVGPPSKDLFRRMIEIGNMGAKAAGFHAYKWHFKVLIDEFIGKIQGYHDKSAIWKDELGIDELETVVEDLYAEVEPLYIQLYTFVRGRLASADKTGTILPKKPLPAHILGRWQNIIRWRLHW